MRTCLLCRVVSFHSYIAINFYNFLGTIFRKLSVLLCKFMRNSVPNLSKTLARFFSKCTAKQFAMQFPSSGINLGCKLSSGFNLHLLGNGMLMNCFWGMVDQQKALSLISSWDHCQRFSPCKSSTPCDQDLNLCKI